MLGVNTPALPASLRRTNQRTLMSLLLRLGSASRADLAKAAGISQPTAGKITAELLQLGLVQETASPPANGSMLPTSPRLGRPGQMLSLDGRLTRFIAIEVGVNETHVSILPVAVSLQDHWQHRFATPDSPGAWLRELKALSNQLETPTAWGVLVSLPGVVDESSGHVLFSPNLHWLEQINIVDQIRTLWKLPVLPIQEIRALALGHITATGEKDFFLVDFGQGVGGAIVSGGQLYANAVPLAGEVGHTPVFGNERNCGCGATGCLETLVSEQGLLASFTANVKRHQKKIPADWHALVSHVQEYGLEPWLSETFSAAGRTIAGALNVLGIQRVIVTGLVSDLPPIVLDFLFDQIKRGAMWARFGSVLCERAPRRRAAGLVAMGLDRLILPEDVQRGALAEPRAAKRKPARGAKKPARLAK